MMSNAAVFPPEEFERRLRAVRQCMSRDGLDVLLVSTPENIYYLTGLDHMGYFAYQMLILPLTGTPVLVTRAMEAATVRDQVPDLIHYGYADGSRPLPPAAADDADARIDLAETFAGSSVTEPSIGRGNRPGGHAAPVAETCRALADLGLAKAELGLEEGGSFLTYRIADGIKSGIPDARWHDATGLVDECRVVQSDLELANTRRAAVISDAMMRAARATAGIGVNEREVMAAIYDALFRRGGTYPGFVPLVRSTVNLTHEHGTWDDAELAPGELLFLEMSGCVRRYHAPIGRLVFIDAAAQDAGRAQEICLEAQCAAFDTMRPGVQAGDVYEAWQAVLNRHGLSGYTRHHCGYTTGIGYPPSWSGGGVPVGLRAGSQLRLEAGMVFHLMSWLLRCEHGDSFLSDTVIVTEHGAEMLTQTSRELAVRA
jgi:Xaa-Pro aminopeptidase